MADSDDISLKSEASCHESESDESYEENNDGSTSMAVTDETVGLQSDLPAILDGRYFEIAKKLDDYKVLAKCKLCPNKLLAAQVNSTSNLLKHLNGLIDSINRRFGYLLEFNSSSCVFAAAAYPNFKLRWVPAEKKEWAKEIFIAQAKKYAPSSLLDQSIIQHHSAQSTPDTFFDFDDDISVSENRSSDSEVTIECLRYLEDGYSPSLDVLQRYPVVKTVFRKLNATVPSSAPVERLFSKGALISVPRRNRLGDKRFEQLLLIQANGYLLTEYQ